MSLYGQYIKEREGKDIVECEDGFATYLIAGEECYIENLYVVPEKRRTHLATQLADQIAIIAKERGCKYLTGSVAPNTKNATSNIIVLISYGMRLLRSTPNLIYFGKELT